MVKTQKIITLNFEELKNGIIKTNLGNITKDNIEFKSLFNSCNQDIYVKANINDIDYDIRISTKHWFSGKGKYITIKGISPKDYNGSKESFIWKASRIFINNFICKQNDIPNVLDRIEFDWGEIRIEKFNDPHYGSDGFIVIKFNGDHNDWINN